MGLSWSHTDNNTLTHICSNPLSHTRAHLRKSAQSSKYHLQPINCPQLEKKVDLSTERPTTRATLLLNRHWCWRQQVGGDEVWKCVNMRLMLRSGSLFPILHPCQWNECDPCNVLLTARGMFSFKKDKRMRACVVALNEMLLHVAYCTANHLHVK